MISDATFDLMREAWAAQIPEPYRLRKKVPSGVNYTIGAIIAPPPPLSLVELFLRSVFGEPHLTAKQLQAKASRQAMAGPGRKKADADFRARPRGKAETEFGQHNDVL